MKPKLYLESTIPSYYVARPSRDLIMAAQQQMTREWWMRRRKDFDIYVSQVVIDEVVAGDREMARQRRELLKPFGQLELSPEATSLAVALIRSGPLPRKATRDALHIAVSAVHEMQFLLTWNCRHIANAEMLRKIQSVCLERGFNCPVVCTPGELMGDQTND